MELFLPCEAIWAVLHCFWEELLMTVAVVFACQRSWVPNENIWINPWGASDPHSRNQYSSNWKWFLIKHLYPSSSIFICQMWVGSGPGLNAGAFVLLPPSPSLLPLSNSKISLRFIWNRVEKQSCDSMRSGYTGDTLVMASNEISSERNHSLHAQKGSALFWQNSLRSSLLRAALRTAAKYSAIDNPFVVSLSHSMVTTC